MSKTFGSPNKYLTIILKVFGIKDHRKKEKCACLAWNFRTKVKWFESWSRFRGKKALSFCKTSLDYKIWGAKRSVLSVAVRRLVTPNKLDYSFSCFLMQGCERVDNIR